MRAALFDGGSKPLTVEASGDLHSEGNDFLWEVFSIRTMAAERPEGGLRADEINTFAIYDVEWESAPVVINPGNYQDCITVIEDYHHEDTIRIYYKKTIISFCSFSSFYIKTTYFCVVLFLTFSRNCYNLVTFNFLVHSDATKTDTKTLITKVQSKCSMNLWPVNDVNDRDYWLKASHNSHKGAF